VLELVHELPPDELDLVHSGSPELAQRRRWVGLSAV
jgi:hypothetical protein